MLCWLLRAIKSSCWELRIRFRSGWTLIYAMALETFDFWIDFFMSHNWRNLFRCRFHFVFNACDWKWFLMLPWRLWYSNLHWLAHVFSMSVPIPGEIRGQYLAKQASYGWLRTKNYWTKTVFHIKKIETVQSNRFIDVQKDMCLI